MSVPVLSDAPPPAEAFRHEAFLYSGLDEFVAGTLPFVEGGLRAGEPVLVVVDRAKVDLLRGELGPDADRVCFADMAEVGRNPARIIPAWRDFLDDRAPGGRPVRGIGEPIWAGRSDTELAECQRHESLLNVAFGDGSGWWLLCPYDVMSLPELVLDEARRSHPFVLHGGRHEPSPAYQDRGPRAAGFLEPLPEPPGPVQRLDFGPERLPAVRHATTRSARRARLGSTRTDELVLAVHELATNSLRHGGGRGTLRIWRDGPTLVCEVSDRGRIVAPLIGRERPPAEREGGRGLWLVNQLCDLVQIRSGEFGTVVRLHVASG